ncbi:carboxypeptidase inhibitor SmCI-like [Pollicipes pollicipes]|uniref:carboxypeptidase inhibitor SmCI-like n=1 Tax=Pollicipes pollicipes TaxID=41117 RepID=UPI001885648A|nr:carboxypeptidase inhibitor SmCI-like [Pollicipes pollicipes]
MQECLQSCAGGGEGGAICRLPVEPGSTCRGRLRRWAFSTDTGRCEWFFYTGCDGNANNFESRAECQSRCGGDVSQGGEDRGPPEFCQLPPRRLLGCRPSGGEQRFYFNRERRSCDSFTYRGCDSGDNMFTSRESCLSVCAPGERGEREDERPQFCRVQPEDIAGCRPGSRETKFYFSATAGRCRSFESVGCERGRNVFLTRRECEQACGDRDAGGEVENQPRLCRVEPEEDPNCRPGRRETKYYFSTAVGRCRSFVSVGCERGRNVFLTARECEEGCENRDTGGPSYC